MHKSGPCSPHTGPAQQYALHPIVSDGVVWSSKLPGWPVNIQAQLMGQTPLQGLR